MSEREREDAEARRAAAEEERELAEAGRVEAEGPHSLELEDSRREAEAGRVVAEDEREIAELKRANAETNEGEHGRVQAEQRRVVAESHRKKGEVDIYRRVTTLWALRFSAIFLVPLLVVVAFLYRDNQRLDDTVEKLDKTIERLEQETVDRCIASAQNRDGIRATIVGSLTALGYELDKDGVVVENKDGPIDYYRERPEERADALALAVTSLTKTFPPIVCPPPPVRR